jgi:M6 family metalloprotease-like protein
MVTVKSNLLSCARDLLVRALMLSCLLIAPLAPLPSSAQSGVPPGLDLTSGPRALEEFGVRHEAALGTPSCTAGDVAAGVERCMTGPWLSTRSPRFVPIKKTGYFRSHFEVVNGIRMSSSFVAQHDDMQVAIVFSAEAFVRDDSVGTGRRMFVRALIDGQPADPADVVFATGPVQTPRSFIFATTVNTGIHTVEMQWMVDRGAEAHLRDATLLVRTGLPYPPRDGTLVASAAPSGPTQSTTANAWTNVPGLGGWAYVPAHGVLTMSVSAESFVTGGDETKRMFVRALVDGAPASPGDVVFARGSGPQSRAMTFGKTGLATGWHFVAFQWQVDAGAVAHVGDRAQMLAAYPSTANNPTHPFLSPPSGDPLVTQSQEFEPLFDLGTVVAIGPKGNGEIAVIFSGEAQSTPFNSAVEIALAIDEVFDPDSIVALTDGHELAQAKTFTFAAKQLTPGPHNVGIYWRVTAAGPATATLGDRSIAVMSETGFIPDIAEALPFGPARFPNDNLIGLEAVIGTRAVLTVLWDPHRPDHGEPSEPDQTSIPVASMVSTLYGANNSTNDYFHKVSGGRFGIENAGVLGWFDNSSVIWETIGDDLPFCINGYKTPHIAKRADALLQADAVFDFSQYDLNEDGVLEVSELAIIMVIPQDVGFGKARVQVNDPDCDVPPLELDGVLIPEIVEWYTSLQNGDLMVAAHEIAHQTLGLDDIYSVPNVTAARKLSLMSLTVEAASEVTTTTHLDPLHKLALGWVTPEIVDHSGVYALQDTKLSGKVAVLPRYRKDPVLPWFDSRGQEYLLVENRQWNLPGLYDVDLNDRGIAVWHVVSEPDDNANAPRGIPVADWQAMDQTQARLGLRLLKQFDSYDAATGMATVTNDDTLWDGGEDDLLSGPCNSAFPQNFASWSDCSASGYSLRFLSLPANTMPVLIKTP